LKKNILSLNTDESTSVTFIQHIDKIPKNDVITKKKKSKPKTHPETPKKEPDIAIYSVTQENTNPQPDTKQSDLKTFGYALQDDTPYYPWGCTPHSLNTEYILLEDPKLNTELSLENFQPNPIQEPEKPEIQCSDIYIRDIPINQTNDKLFYFDDSKLDQLNPGISFTFVK